MSGVAAFAVLAAVGGGLAWLVAWSKRRDKEADFERSVHARKLGWHYDGTRAGRIDYRFAGGRDGIAWTMWYDSDRGDKSPSPKAYWLCENVRTQRLSLVILGRRRYAMESGMVGRVLIGVVTGIASAVTGRDAVPDKGEFYESCVLLEGLPPEFDRRFAVAIAPDMPRGWLDSPLQRQLLRWPEVRGNRSFNPDNALEINLGPRGLSLVLQRMPTDLTHWQYLAELGEALAARLAAARH